MQCFPHMPLNDDRRLAMPLPFMFRETRPYHVAESVSTLKRMPKQPRRIPASPRGLLLFLHSRH